MAVQNTRTSKARPKRKEKPKHVQNLGNTLRIPLSPIFLALCDFFRFFLFQQRLPLQFLTFPPLPILSLPGTLFVFLPEACQVQSVEFSLLLIVTDYFFDCYDCSLTALVFLVFDTPEVTKIVLPQKFYKILRRRQIVHVGPRNWTKKVSRVTYNTERHQRVPHFSFFGITRPSIFCIKGFPIHQYVDILKSFCYFRALDMAPTWAGPGLFIYKNSTTFAICIFLDSDDGLLYRKRLSQLFDINLFS